MKGVILAGGTGSRLMPLTKVTNKHLLPVGDRPMILHPVGKLVEAGIDDIMIITGPEHMGAIVNLLGSGKDYGCTLTYRVQDEAGGVAQALGLCEGFVNGGKCCVVLADNIFTAPLGPFVHEYADMEKGALLLLKKVPDPGRYGVAELGPDGLQVVSIEEKPEKPKSDLAVVGIYFYDSLAFETIRGLKPSWRNELEITDVSNAYLKAGLLKAMELPGEWTDAGTFPSLKLANEIMAGAERRT